MQRIACYALWLHALFANAEHEHELSIVVNGATRSVQFKESDNLYFIAANSMGSYGIHNEHDTHQLHSAMLNAVRAHNAEEPKDQGTERPRLERAPPISTQGSLLHLWQTAVDPEGHLFDRWMEYAEHYEYHMQKLVRKIDPGEKIRMLEIGVQSGGSVRVWAEYFRDRLHYVGMDIDQRCKRSERPEEQIYIEIGSQLEPADLIDVCNKHGPFHVIIDDGGHTKAMMETALYVLFPEDGCMQKNSLYIIEDMHTMGFGLSFSKNPTAIPGIAAEVFRRIHYYWASSFESTWAKPADQVWADVTESVSLYDSMMVITRGSGPGPLHRIMRGEDSFANEQRRLNKPGAYG
jgi:hypothetical protein